MASDGSRAFPILAGLTATERADLLAEATEQRFTAGEMICEEGVPNGNLYLIVDGEVEVSRVGSGKQSSPVATIGPGAILGELSWISGTAPTATVRCVRPTVALRLDGSELTRQLDERHAGATKLVLALLRVLAGRLLVLNEELASITSGAKRTHAMSEVEGLRERMLRDWSF